MAVVRPRSDARNRGAAMQFTKSSVARRDHGGNEAATRALAGSVKGQVLLPGVAGYDESRRVFNAMIDRRPAMIIRCAGADDVVESVEFARAHDLPVTVKGGGHGVAGRAVADGGVMLDLSAMMRVRVNAIERTATVEPGVTLGELDRETELFGLATPTRGL